MPYSAVRPYGPCTQVDIGLDARVDTRPRTPSSVGFVYIHEGLRTVVGRPMSKMVISTDYNKGF